jgi:hypothetical protein
MMKNLKKHQGELVYSVLLGVIIGLIMGFAGNIMNVHPLFVSILSGAATGCSIVILFENKKILGKSGL